MFQMYTIREIIGRELLEHTEDGFQSRLFEICREHHSDRRALIFAFIICEFEDPQVMKVVRDPDYWEALNKITGSALSVFSLYSPTEERARDNVSSQRELKKVQAFIAEYFGCDGLNISPSVVFFQVSKVDDEDKVIDSYFVRLDEKKQEDAFLELCGIFKEAVKALEMVEDQYRGNVQEVFFLVKDAMEQRKLVKNVVRGVKTFSSLEGVAKAILWAFA
jgi:hypothetical protein